MSVQVGHDGGSCIIRTCQKADQSDKDAVLMTTKSTNKQSVALAALAREVDEPDSRFQALWNEAERIKRTNIELEQSLDQLVDRIRKSVGPFEMDMGRAMRVQIDNRCRNGSCTCSMTGLCLAWIA